MPAGGISSPILQIEAATISQEPVEMVEDLEAEVKRKCAACLDVLRKALPVRGEEGGEATNDALHVGDAIDSALIGRTIEKCAMMLVSIIHDCPIAHKSWPIDSEVRRPCCCDIVSRTRQEIEEELRVRYGDLSIFPCVDESSSLECDELVEETDGTGVFEERPVTCRTFVGSCVKFSAPLVVDGFDRGLPLGVSGETAVSMKVGCDDVPRVPEPRSPVQMKGLMIGAVAEKTPVNSEGDVAGDREIVKSATVSVKMEEVAAEEMWIRSEGRGDGKSVSSNGASATASAASAAATVSSGAGSDVRRGRGSIGIGRKSHRCISSSANKISKASTSGRGGRRGSPVVASPPEAEPGASTREILKSDSGAALAAAPGTGNGRSSQSKEKVVVEAIVHVRNGQTPEGRSRHRGNRQDLDKRREQASKPRCLREGCPEPAVHGPEGGHPLWCHLDYVVQESGRPIRCSVLESNSKACWKETGWAWPGKPPTHCNMHRHSGMVDVVEFLRERFDEIVWPKLLALGWRTEKAGRLQYWLPHEVVRGTAKFRSRVDYFDRKPQVIRHCLRTDKLYGLLLGDLLEQTSGAFKGATAKPKDDRANEGSSNSGVSIYTSKNTSLNVTISESSSAKVKTAAVATAAPTVTAQKSKHEQQQLTQRQKQEKVPQSKSGPAPKAMFTHQLFSLKPPAAKKPSDTSTAATSKQAEGLPNPERRQASKDESADDSGSVRVTRKESSHRREYKWQRAAKLRAAGRDSRIVTGAGISQSFKRAKMFLKRMEPRLEPREDIGDPLVALVASLGAGFDAFRLLAEKESVGDAAGRFDSSRSEASVAGRGDLEHLKGAGANACSILPDRRLSCSLLPGGGYEGKLSSVPLPPSSMATNPCGDGSASLQQQSVERKARSKQGYDNRVQSGGDNEAVAWSEKVGDSGRVKVEMERDKAQNGIGKDHKGKRKAVCLLKF